MKQVKYVVKDELGIHARPAGMLVKTVAGATSSVKLQCGGKEADAKRLLAVMGLAVKKGQEVTFVVEGPDEAAVATQIESFMKANL